MGLSTLLQVLIWRDGFPGPICARGHWFAPVCDDCAEFVDGVNAVWATGAFWAGLFSPGLGLRPHCETMFNEVTEGPGDE